MSLVNKLTRWLCGLYPNKGIVTVGYQPTVEGDMSRPPRGSGVPRRSILPEAHLDISMPHGVKPPRQVCKHCGR